MVKALSTLCALAAVLAACGGAASAEALYRWDDLEPGPYGVGFRVIAGVDGSRAIRAGSGTPVIQPRPVRIYLWYPAVAQEGAEPMTFRRYAEAADEDVWPDGVLPGARRRIGYDTRPFPRSVTREDYVQLLDRQVQAYEDAPAAEGTFPLIVVGQGLYYESPVTHAALCERLAGYGFVVATCPLVGTNSPLVHLDVVDLETQVRDMEFSVGQVRQLPFVAAGRFGVLGFDMGGMAAVVLAMRHPDVDAFASIDAGILFGHAETIPSGIPFTSPHFDPALLRCPWLHATQKRFGAPPPGHEGTDLFRDAVHSERYLLLVDGAGHADFTSYALLEDRQPMPAYWGPRRGGEKQRYEAVCRYLTRFFQAYLQGNQQGRGFLAADPEQRFPGLALTMERRAARPGGATYSDFLNALLVGDIAAARAAAGSIREQRPDGPLHDEVVLNRLGYHLMFSWQLMDEAIEVFRLNTELHPGSWNTWDSLAEAYWRNGNPEQAIVHVRKVLELDPGNERAGEILRQLEEALAAEEP